MKNILNRLGSSASASPNKLDWAAIPVCSYEAAGGNAFAVCQQRWMDKTSRRKIFYKRILNNICTK
jgi:hypothetical protein